MPLNKSSEGNITYLLILTVSMYFFALDFYAPALPLIQETLNQSYLKVQWTITLFTIGFWLAQLPFGVLLSRYNNQAILLMSSAAFFISSFIAASATSIEVIYLCRFIQGVACAGMYVLGFSTARKLIPQHRLSTVMPASSLGYTLLSALAPILGGYLVLSGQWQLSFFGMALPALLLFLSAWWLYPAKEINNQLDKSPLSLAEIFSTYLAMLKDTRFVISSFISISSVVAMLLYYQIASFILIAELEMSAVAFGFISFALVTASVFARVIYLLFLRHSGADGSAVKAMFFWGIASFCWVLLAALSSLLSGHLLIISFIASYTGFVFSLSIVHCYAQVVGFSTANPSKSAYYSATYGFLTSSYIALGSLVASVGMPEFRYLIMCMFGLSSIAITGTLILYLKAKVINQQTGGLVKKSR